MEVEMNLTVLYEVKSFYIMLDVNNVLPTLYKDRKMKNLRSTTSTKDENEDERRKTNSVDRKNSRKKKVNFQNKCAWEGGALRGAASAYFLPSSQYS